MGKKRGRPKEVNSRGNIRKTRMSDEEAFILKRMCERESLTTSEALRLGVEALDYLSKNGGIYCVTENQNYEPWNYCDTEIDDEDDDLY